MNNPELVVMAAGMGSRYGGLKQIDPIDPQGHIIIDFSIYDAIRAGFRDITFIIKHAIEKDFREVMDKHLADKGVNVKYVFQELDRIPEGCAIPEGRTKPYGTGHALACCAGVVKGPFAVINADDFYGRSAFEEIYKFLQDVRDTDRYHYAMVGYLLKNTVTETGTVARGICETSGGYLSSVTEHTAIATDAEGNIWDVVDGVREDLLPDTVVSMNLWGFTPSYLDEAKARFAKFFAEKLPQNPQKAEFYLPSVVSELVAEKRADVKMLTTDDKWFGVTYKEDKQKVIDAVRALKDAGVYPEEF